MGEHLYTADYGYPSFHLTMHCYMCSGVSRGLVLKEHYAARWLASKEFDSINWLPDDLEILPKIVRFNQMSAGLE